MFFSLSLSQVVTSKKRIFLNELPGMICRFLRGNCIFLPSILRTSKFDFFPGNINVAKKFPYFEHFPLGTALKSLNSLPKYCAAKMVTGQLLSLFPLYICLAPKGDINKRRKEKETPRKNKKSTAVCIEEEKGGTYISRKKINSNQYPLHCRRRLSLSLSFGPEIFSLFGKRREFRKE